MKTLYRVLSLAILLTAFSALTFAQEDLAALFEKFKTEAKAPCGQRGPALVTGKIIVEKFGNDELNKQIIDFVKKRMALIEKDDPACKVENPYVEAFTAKNWANVFTTGKALIAAEGDSPKALDVQLDLVQVGFDRALLEKVDTFNNDTLSLAKTALQSVEAGKPSNSKQYGAFVKLNTKENAQTWLNYIIGWMMYNKLNQQKDALPYLYKAANIGTEKKNDSSIYTNIGKFYFDEAVSLDTKYREMRKANNNVDTDESKALLALAKGTADRASDAFGRALKIVAADPKGANAKVAITKTLTELYKFRFNLAEAKQVDVDKYVSSLTAKPMPDPATAVTPVVEEATPTPTTTTSTTETTTPTKEATPTTKAATPTKEASTTNTATTNKAATPVKKPVTKKKGTR